MEGNDGRGEEEAAVERQLEQQLAEQKDSFSAVEEALFDDPSNEELLMVHKELLLVIKDSEEGLLHLKRSRLLRETDIIFSENKPECPIPVQNVPLEFKTELFQSHNLSIGSKCRFRHIDGCWYNGRILEIQDSILAKITFLTPTSESMLMCKFFLQKQCRFGSNCRLSHGFDVPISLLKPYIPTVWQHSLVGSRIWAYSGNESGIWRTAELESWDEEVNLGRVIFLDDGSSAELGADALSLTQYAGTSDDDKDDDKEDCSSSLDYLGGSNEEDEDVSDHQGLGFLEATKLQTGVQTETAVFAKWEHHTRGIASKMMASMGYREGMGLGMSGQGIVKPIAIKVLPPKQSLDHALGAEETRDDVRREKKRSRGGQRKRDKKFAAAVRASKVAEAEESTPDVFSFINNQLVGVQELRRNGRWEGVGEGRKEDRRSLVVFEEEIKELRSQATKLEEMAARNNGRDKMVYEGVMRKLKDTKKAIVDAEAAHASTFIAVTSKEKEKKWLKF